MRFGVSNLSGQSFGAQRRRTECSADKVGSHRTENENARYKDPRIVDGCDPWRLFDIGSMENPSVASKNAGDILRAGAGHYPCSA